MEGGESSSVQLQSLSLFGCRCLPSSLVNKRLCSVGQAFLKVWSQLRACYTACPSRCDNDVSEPVQASLSLHLERTCLGFLLAPVLSCLERGPVAGHGQNPSS